MAPRNSIAKWVLVLFGFLISLPGVVCLLRTYDHFPTRAEDAKKAGNGNVSDTVGDLDFLEWTQSKKGEHRSKVSSSATKNLWRRALPQNYQEAVAKGMDIISMLEAPTHCLQQSPWTQFSDLERYGWDTAEGFPLEMTFIDQPALNEAQNELGIPENQVQTYTNYKHDRSTKPRLVEFPKTGAYYENIFDTDGGVIYAMKNYGPDWWNEQMILNIPPSQMVPLKQWSDVAFLGWQETCTDDDKNIKGLRAIVRSQIRNENTMNVVFDVLQRDGRNGQDIGYPGVSYRKGQEQFAAVLATSNVIGVAYLLGQHRYQLGWKEITSIQLYCANCEDELPPDGDYDLYILVKVGDVSEAQQQIYNQQQPRLRRRQLTGRPDNHESGSYASITSRTSDDPPPKDAKYQSYEDFVKAGQLLIEMINAGTDCVPQSQWADLDDLSQWGWDSFGGGTTVIADENVLECLNNAPLSGSTDNAHYILRHETKTEHDGAVYYPTNANFDQWFTTQGIFAINVQGVKHMGSSRFTSPSVTGDPNPFPKLRALSDITYLTWLKYNNGDFGKMQEIKVIAHIDIMNQVTQWIIRQARIKLDNPETADEYLLWPGIAMNIGSDEHAALLASPNGEGVAWFLAQHKSQLTRKEVYQVRIWTNIFEEYNIAYYIRPNANPIAENVGEKIKRAYWLNTTTDLIVRRSNRVDRRAILYSDPDQNRDDDLEWIQAVETGGYLLALVNAPTSCVQQSMWTNYAALATYGWTIQGNPRSYSPTSFGYEYEKMIQQFNLPIESGDLWKVNWRHTRASRPVGNPPKTYWPTGGQYKNVYNPEAILADFNFSPDYRGQLKIPPITGADVVPLKQWSDVTFLAWQDYCQGNPHRMQALRYIARMNIANPQTKDMVNEALKRTGQEFTSINPGWDRRVTFPITSSEAQVILSTPNGQGIAWFLAQHKQQLGWKTISSVIVFKSTLLNIVFELAPVANAEQLQQ